MTERTLRRISPKRIILAGSVIAVAMAMVIGATGAFFSDEETSLNNIFTAGAIDLQIDNESYAIDCNIPGADCTGQLVASQHTSWELRDLTVEKFFDFIDLKPGDYGEDTISIHVNNNDAWLCAAAQITEDSDVNYTEPELEDDPTVNEADPVNTDGELDDELNFVFWADDGDNVLETCGDRTDQCFDEPVFLSGNLGDLGDAGQITLADTSGNIFGGNGPIAGDTTFYIGKAWCFGDLSIIPEPQDDLDNVGPLVRNNILCNGEPVDNAAQTDRVVGDIQFYAEQSRNNDDFLCSEWIPDFPVQEERPVVGAALTEYQVPQSCTTTVGNVGDLVNAVNDASTDDTICVEDGDYDLTDPLVIDTPGLTLASLTGPTNTATITGGIFVDASNVTITGFVFDGFDFMGASENAAIYVHNETGQGSGTSLEGLKISYNIFDAPAGAADSITTVNGGTGSNAVINETASASAQFSNTVIMHNRFDGWRRGVFLNPSSNIEIAYNDFYNNFVGSANDGPDSNTIHNNDFDGNIAEAVGVNQEEDGAATNDGILTVNTNNFAPAGGPTSGNEVNQYGSDAEPNVDATGNWWDGEAEGDRTNDTAEVDTSSPEALAFPEN